MSLVTLVAVKDGLAISADSRRTFQRPGSDAFHVLTDSEPKLLRLWDRVFIATLGAADAAGEPVPTHLLRMERQVTAPASLPELHDALRRHFRGVAPSFDCTLVLGCWADRPRAQVLRLSEESFTELGTPGVYSFGGRDAVEQAIINGLRSVSPPDVARMTLEGAIDYSRHLVRTVIDQTRFSSTTGVVGGAIDTGVVMAPGGTGWVFRKPV